MVITGLVNIITLLDNPWFVYSKAEDGLCVLFANVKGLGLLVCKKFDHWTKKSTKFASHNSKKYHQLAMTQVDALKTNMNKPGSSIEDRIRQTILMTITYTYMLCHPNDLQCNAKKGNGIRKTSCYIIREI